MPAFADLIMFGRNATVQIDRLIEKKCFYGFGKRRRFSFTILKQVTIGNNKEIFCMFEF